MALTYINLTGTFDDGSGNPLSGQVVFTPSQTVYAAGIPVASTSNPVIVQVISGSLQTVKLLSTSNAGLTFAGLTGFFTWSVQITLGGVTQPGWSFFLPLTPTTVDLYSLANTAVASSLYVPIAGGTMTGELAAPDVSISGLTGAVAASRYVGATASGSPASGTFRLGDFVIDQTGKVWICTVAGTPGTWTAAGPTIPVTISQGGTGQTTAAAAFSALSPLTTLGDLLYENATPAAARLAGSTSATKNFLTQTGTGSVSAAPAWGTIAAGDLPTGTTSTQGALQLDGTAADIQPLGTQAAGAIGKAADSGHVHPLRPGMFDVTASAYGAKGNGKVVNDLVLNGTTTATSASAGFTSGDTGKSILIAGGAGGGAALVTTITFVNSTTVTLGSSAGASITTSAIYGTDDTAAINSAYSAARTYAAANGGYAEVTGPPLIYCLAAATQKGTSNSLHYNSQIPLIPFIGPGAQKTTVAFVFGDGGVAPPMFSGTVPQAIGGAVFVSMLTGLTVDGTFGVPSVIGGPTDSPSGVASTWNNHCPVVKGLTIVWPLNPTVAGLDFRGCAAASVEKYFGTAFDTVANMASTAPTHSWATGLWMPVELSNDESFIGQAGVYGTYYGVAVYAHASAHTIKALYCGYGVFIGGNGNDKHGASISYISAELCGTAVQVDGNSGITIPVHIGMLDAESVGNFGGFGGNHIQDANNGLGGQIKVNDNSGSASVLSISGGGNCEIIAANEPRGFVTPPSVPGTTVALKNPFWRHANVYLTSGGAAVTAIAVNGTATGLTLGTSGTVLVRVPSGATITLTYASTAPTWTWELD